MSKLPEMMERLLEPLLRRLNGWKSIVGVAILLLAMILDRTDAISPEMAAEVYYYVKWVLGVGIAHKIIKADQQRT